MSGAGLSNDKIRVDEQGNDKSENRAALVKNPLSSHRHLTNAPVELTSEKLVTATNRTNGSSKTSNGISSRDDKRSSSISRYPSHRPHSASNRSHSRSYSKARSRSYSKTSRHRRNRTRSNSRSRNDRETSRNSSYRRRSANSGRQSRSREPDNRRRHHRERSLESRKLIKNPSESHHMQNPDTLKNSTAGDYSSKDANQTSTRNNLSTISTNNNETSATVSSSSTSSTWTINALMVEEATRKIRREEMRRKKELEDARRDDNTVLVLNLGPNTEEREIYEFFSDNAGKVRDVQIIRDQRSGRSKGVAYVEFYSADAVIKALTSTGKQINGNSFRVQASQAEKNRAARAAKLEAEAQDAPCRLYIGNLVESLKELRESELRQLFSTFGEIFEIEIPRDPYSGERRGYAFLTMKRASEARDAIRVMNGFELGDQKLKVALATDDPRSLASAAELIQTTNTSASSIDNRMSSNLDNDYLETDVDGGGLLLRDRSSKQALMKKLMRPEDNDGMSGSSGYVQSGLQTNGTILSGQTIPKVVIKSKNVVMSNMFTVSDVDLISDPTFFDDLLSEVGRECEKYGVIDEIFVNKLQLDGRIWLRFVEMESADRAVKSLNGRNFAGKPITVECMSDATYIAFQQKANGQ